MGILKGFTDSNGNRAYITTCVKCWNWMHYIQRSDDFFVLQNPQCPMGGTHMDSFPVKNKDIKDPNKEVKFELPDSWVEPERKL